MRLAEIERHVASMEELGRIVGAMRAIASLRVQEAVQALASVRQYGDSLAKAVREALAIADEEGTGRTDPGRPIAIRSSDGTYAETGPGSSAPRTPARPRKHRVIVLFASEHGFVGAFNEHLVEAAVSGLAASDTLLIVGSRGAAFAKERGYAPAGQIPMATRLASIPDVVRRLEEALYPGIARGEVVRAEAVFGRYERNGAAGIDHRRLFPLELSPTERGRARLLPLHDLPAPELLARLTAEYVLAQLTEAAVESFAAENGARFEAMQSAHENVARKLEALRLDASRARQEEVTTELLDLLAGTLAITGQRR